MKRKSMKRKSMKRKSMKSKGMKSKSMKSKGMKSKSMKSKSKKTKKRIISYQGGSTGINIYDQAARRLANNERRPPQGITWRNVSGRSCNNIETKNECLIHNDCFWTKKKGLFRRGMECTSINKIRSQGDTGRMRLVRPDTVILDRDRYRRRDIETEERDREVAKKWGEQILADRQRERVKLSKHRPELVSEYNRLVQEGYLPEDLDVSSMINDGPVILGNRPTPLTGRWKGVSPEELEKLIQIGKTNESLSKQPSLTKQSSDSSSDYTTPRTTF